jgi:hypothetical protein
MQAAPISWNPFRALSDSFSGHDAPPLRGPAGLRRRPLRGGALRGRRGDGLPGLRGEGRVGDDGHAETLEARPGARPPDWNCAPSIAVRRTGGGGPRGGRRRAFACPRSGGGVPGAELADAAAPRPRRRRRADGRPGRRTGSAARRNGWRLVCRTFGAMAAKPHFVPRVAFFGETRLAFPKRTGDVHPFPFERYAPVRVRLMAAGTKPSPSRTGRPAPRAWSRVASTHAPESFPRIRATAPGRSRPP